MFTSLLNLMVKETLMLQSIPSPLAESHTVTHLTAISVKGWHTQREILSGVHG